MKRVLIILLTLMTYNLYTQEISVTANNTYLNVGEWGVFEVTASGDIKKIEVTEAENIVLKQTGKRTGFNSINGKTSKSYTLTYEFQISEEGNYTLPQFIVTNSKGEKKTSELINIYVSKLEDSTDIEQDLSKKFETEYVKLYIDLPNRNLYVGEAIPVTVTAYFSTRVKPGLERSPYVESGSFMLDTGEQKESKDKVINGERWIELSWDSFLTPLKHGELSLEVKLDSYIVVSSGSGFFTNTEREEITTSTSIDSISINQLPLEGRPEDFTGAIGNFSLKSGLDRLEMNVGDPVTLSMDLYGYGNFQRVSEPVIQNSDDSWKLYHASSTYNGSNKSNYKGVKTFQQIMSPNSEHITDSPVFSLSYFNPEEERYIELETKSFPISVSPGLQIEGNSAKKDLLEFDNKKAVLKHKHSGKYYSLANENRINIFYLISLILILLTISYLLVIKIWSKRRTGIIKVNKLSKELNNFESSGNIIGALQLLKEFMIQESKEITTVSSSALTSYDLESGILKDLIELMEQNKYMNRSITESDYDDIKSRIIKEYT